MALTTITDILRPTNVDDVPRMLRDNQSAMVMGGGTFIHGLAARGLVTHVETLIDLSSLNLNELERSGKSLRIGATTTFAELEESNELREISTLKALFDATAYPPQQIKNAATVGGCVGGACPYLDLPIVLLSLDATVSIVGSSGERKIPLDELFVSLFQTSLADDEFITGFDVPLPSKATASSFEKLETTSNDLSIVSTAVRVSDGWLKSKGNRIFIGGGIGETPFRCRNAEDVLNGAKLEDDAIAAAAQAAMDEIEPFGDHRASAAYRKQMTRVLVSRNLLEARSRLEK